MGCCAAIPEVPAVIIPDPTEPSHFYCVKAGTFSSNFQVKQATEDGPLWLFIRKTGKIFSPDSYYVLENFVRNDPENPKDGQALAVCKMDDLSPDDYKQHSMETHEDSDDSDGYSSDSDDGTEDITQKCKWVYKGKCKFYKDRKRSEVVANLRVKAKGKAKRVVRWVDSENGQYKSTIDKKIKVKKFHYKLDYKGQDVPLKCQGKLNKEDPKGIRWECDWFNAKTQGFWSPKPNIQTTAACPDHALACLLAFMVSNELEPRDVTAALRIRWPATRDGDTSDLD